MIASHVDFLSITVIDSRITSHQFISCIIQWSCLLYFGVIVSALLEIVVRLKTLVTDMLRYYKVKHSVWKDKEASPVVLSGRQGFFMHIALH